MGERVPKHLLMRENLFYLLFTFNPPWQFVRIRFIVNKSDHKGQKRQDLGNGRRKQIVKFTKPKSQVIRMERILFVKRYPFHLRLNISSRHPQRLISFWKMQDYGKITTQMLSTRAISVHSNATAKPSDPIVKRRRSIMTISFYDPLNATQKSISEIEEDKQISSIHRPKHQWQEHRKPPEQEHPRMSSGNVRSAM